MKPAPDNDTMLRKADGKIARTRVLSNAFGIAMMSGCLAFSGGAITVVSAYGYSAATQDDFNIIHTPSQQSRNLLSAAGIVAGIGFSGMLTGAFALDTAMRRREKLKQQKYSLTVRIIQDNLKPSSPKR